MVVDCPHQYSSVEESQIEILITVVRQNIELEEDSVQIVQRLRDNLQSELRSIQLYLFADISRYGNKCCIVATFLSLYAYRFCQMAVTQKWMKEGSGLRLT